MLGQAQAIEMIAMHIEGPELCSNWKTFQHHQRPSFSDSEYP